MYEDLGRGIEVGSAMGAIGKSMDSFANMATGGGFEVSETGGAALIKAIKDMREWVNSKEAELIELGQELPLGSSNTAKVLSPYVAQVATDGQGFLTQLMQFRESLTKAEEGINKAMANYQATERAMRSSFGNIEPA